MIFNLLKPLLFALHPENIHEKILALGRVASKHPALLNGVRAIFYLEDERLQTQVGNLRFPNPIGLAAGFDKNAEAVPLLESLGFGAVEVGTVTPKGQAGNEKPRLFRLLADRAIINRMGFNNEGIGAMTHRLQRLKKNIPLGINLGKNKSTPNEEAVQDYALLLEKAYPFGDYFVLNISSPNTPGLRGLQEIENLKPLLRGLLQQRDQLAATGGKTKPLWLKLAPDLQSDELQAICQLALELRLDALVLTNTTVTRPNLTSPLSIETGGLSGKPLRALSNQRLAEAALFTQGRIPLVAVGGIFNAHDVIEKLRLGASFVQVYTSLIFEGPGLIKNLKSNLLKLMEQEGLKSLDQFPRKALKEEK